MHTLPGEVVRGWCYTGSFRDSQKQGSYVVYLMFLMCDSSLWAILTFTAWQYAFDLCSNSFLRGDSHRLETRYSSAIVTILTRTNSTAVACNHSGHFQSNQLLPELVLARSTCVIVADGTGCRYIVPAVRAGEQHALAPE